MKLINKITILLSILMVSFYFTSCEDELNKKPEGGSLTEEQKKKAVEADPSLLSADVAAMYSLMIAREGVVGGHNDFGYASAAMIMDCNGADMTSAAIGYNWFRANESFNDRRFDTDNTMFMWKLFYKQIETAHLVLRPIDPKTKNVTLKQFRGQALAVRAFAYFNLAQLHQFTYVGNEDKPCVPIITETTTIEQALNNPRASVKKVYELITKDLDEAIELLDGYTRVDKGYIDQAVAYGLRARVNLVLNKWKEAAEDAKKALEVSGATPYSKTDVSKPGFWNANDKAVMWANIITPNNGIVKSGIINMPSHLCSFTLNGYVSVGCWKKINQPTFDQIASTDVRKGWWLDENSASPLVADPSFDTWKENAGNDDAFGAYTNVKFGPDNDNYDFSAIVNAQDWFLMRAEEMLFIQAEGLAMSGDVAGAKTVLEDFVKNNRDDSYQVLATTPKELQDEIWFQRRIELWGEGFSFFDIMRLKKPIVRIVNGETSYPVNYRFNIEPTNSILLWLVPKREIEANDGIQDKDNNPTVAPPTPVG